MHFCSATLSSVVLLLAATVMTVSTCVADPPAKLDAISTSHTATSLHISEKLGDAPSNAIVQILIDADDDAKTGYQGVDSHGGYDFMIEGTTVYKFKGTDLKAWSWDKVGSVSVKMNDGVIALDIDLSLLSGRGSTASVLLRTLSSDYQTVLGTSPVTTADLGKSSNSAEKIPEAPEFTASFNQDGEDLVVKVTARNPADLDTVLIFFDTDQNAATGFQPPADPHFGFEQMIQGESLSAHSGDARDGWSWTTVAAIKKTVAGSDAEYRFNAALLKSKKIDAAVWQMSPDWQTRTARYPADVSGTVHITLDASKIHAEIAKPPMPFAEPRVGRDQPARDRFSKITSYCCYYGAGKTSDLSHFDAVILHTPAQKPDQVKKLRDLGVVTIGYESVGEDETLRVGNGLGPGGKASWYFDKNNAGKPDKNGTWSSYYANAADPLWRADRVTEAKRLCNEVGFDGIFLDTIETVDAYPQSRAGMIQLVNELRSALPNKVIVINRGFSLLKESDVSSRIDGLMFEDFTDSYDFDSKQYIEFLPQDMDATRQVMITNVIPATKQYPLKVLALDYCKPEQTDRIQHAFDRAVTFGMVPAVSSISLDEVYDTTKVKPQADPRYLTVQATPASLSFTLKSEQNGFPAGTRIQPSSCFLGYSVAAVIDGIRDRQSLFWSKAAWASAEVPGAEQELEFIFPASIKGGTLKVMFAVDNGTVQASRQIKVEIKPSDNSDWVSLPVTLDSQAAQCNIPNTPIHRLRIVQPPGGGTSGRPDLMWIAQVERAK